MQPSELDNLPFNRVEYLIEKIKEDKEREDEKNKIENEKYKNEMSMQKKQYSNVDKSFSNIPNVAKPKIDFSKMGF